MVWRSNGAAILLVIIMIPDWSNYIKSAMTSDLIFLNALLILAICIIESFINFVLLLLLIETMTCFLNGPFIVMLSLGLGFSSSLMIFFDFFVCRLGNISLIFKTSLVLLIGVKAWVYNFLGFFCYFFHWLCCYFWCISKFHQLPWVIWLVLEAVICWM